MRLLRRPFCPVDVCFDGYRSIAMIVVRLESRLFVFGYFMSSFSADFGIVGRGYIS